MKVLLPVVPKKEKGQSLLEIVVAMAIAILIVAGLVSAVIVAVKNAQFARNQTLATKYGQEGMEWIRSQRDTNWQTFSDRSAADPGRTYCLNSLGWTAGTCATYALTSLFKREAILKTIATDKIEVKMTVSWRGTGGTHQSELSSYFTKPTTWR